MRKTLVVLAAGMGSRYGGLKQIDPVGPADETILDYSVFDAMRAGFARLVFVIRRDIEEDIAESIARFKRWIPVEWVYQELDSLPPGFSVPAGRKKPWGTGHAILMAVDAVRAPFGVINADDFYGAHSFRLLAEHLNSMNHDYAMVGFILRNTLSEFGTVARGVCRVTDDGYLQAITELTHLERDGVSVKYTDGAGMVHHLTGGETVSMNMWCFTPTIFGHLQAMFMEFLSNYGKDEMSEFYIPLALNQIVSGGQERCKVLRTPDSWFGMTYREDRPVASKVIRHLVARGDYPERLWT